MPARCGTPTRKRARAHARGQLGRQIRELVQRCERLYLIAVDIIAMFAEYIQAAMDQATYEIIDDLSPFMAKLQGVWATGKSLEGCPRVLARSHRGLDCLEAEIWPSNTRHRRAFDQCISGDGIHCRISFCRSQEESSSGGWANWDSWVLFLVLVTSNVKGPFRGTHSESSWKRYQY